MPVRIAIIMAAIFFWITACALDSDLSDECYNLVEVEDPDSNTPKEEYEDNGKCTTSEKREKRKTIKIMYTLAGTFTGIFIATYLHYLLFVPNIR